jgi:hypothetical protein
MEQNPIQLEEYVPEIKLQTEAANISNHRLTFVVNLKVPYLLYSVKEINNIIWFTKSFQNFIILD